MIPLLLEMGHSVTVLDRFGEGDTVLAPCCRYEGFTPVKGDARDEALMKTLVAKADVVIPLAALVGAPICAIDPINATTINRDAVVMLTRLVSKNQKLVFATTNSGYGVGEKDKLCTEERRCVPSRFTAPPNARPKLPSWTAAMASPCAWRPCSACRRACALTCWSTISPTGR